MVTGRIALLENNGNAFHQAALAELSDAGFDCGKLALASVSPRDLLTAGYSVLIAHLSAPLDGELAWIQEVAALERPLPLILISQPEVLPALGRLLEHPTVEWLMAPCDGPTLRERATRAMRQARLNELLNRSRQETNHGSQPVSMESFLDRALGNVAGALLDMQHLTRTVAGEDPGREVCHLFDCPRRVSLADAVRDAIHVLEKTKSSFKSKELAELRHRLQAVLKSA